jgi:uncharacterized protein YodC (DUF2158 family)
MVITEYSVYHAAFRDCHWFPRAAISPEGVKHSYSLSSKILCMNV